MTELLLCLLISLAPRGSAEDHSQNVQFSTSDQFEWVEIDLEKSIVKWKGTKPLGSHEGTVKFSKGAIFFDDGNPVKGELYVDMQSIYNTDMPQHETEARRNLTSHLNEDFKTLSFPTAKYAWNNIDIDENEEINLNGQLTITTISNPLTVPIELIEKKKIYEAEFSFNRFDWKIGEGRSWLERRLVDANIKLNVTIYLKE